MEIKQRKWRWLGHTLRKGHGDLTNQALAMAWNPQGKRKPGRPKTTCRRELLCELDERISSLIDASNVAQSTEDWRTIVRSLCSNKN